MTQEQYLEKPTIQDLFGQQTEVDNLESTLKLKREQFFHTCHRWYPEECTNTREQPLIHMYSDELGYELHWIPRSVRSIIAPKLKEELPHTYQMIVKESVNLADAEKALGDEVKKYITTRTTYSPKIIHCAHEE